MKKILILGASGSIGTQSLDLISSNKVSYCVTAISVGKNIKVLHGILNNFCSIKYVYCLNFDGFNDLKIKYPNIKFYNELDGFYKFMEESKDYYDMVLNALTGFIGVEPSITAVKLKKDLALANKETIVVAGDILKQEIKANNVKLYPIDSEHVAIEKCLKNVKKKEVKNIILTCSGGPFRTKNTKELQEVSKEDALKHPTWSMGNKITIDSATLINKVFEIVEAHYLFNFSFKRIKVLIHPQSLIHSMIQLNDGNMLMDFGINDMRIPISYALSENKRIDINLAYNFKNTAELQFFEPNKFQSKIFKYAKFIISKKGNMGAIINAANDYAVDMFLNGKISFLKIYELIDYAIINCIYIKKPSLNDIILTNNNVKYILSKI